MTSSPKDLFKATTQKKPITIEVSKLWKIFGNHVVLKDVNLRIEPGEIFVLMGPSGVGKSVFLSLLSGLSKPTKGTLRFYRDPAESPQSYMIGLVFQSGALFNSLTVFDNLALYLREHRLCSEKEIERRIAQILDMLGLKNVSEVMPSELSGGMRKRVALARGLLMEPDILLFDEPTSELDPITSASISELIGYVNRELRITTCVVSHDTHLAQGIGNHIAFLHDGAINDIYTPQTLIASTQPFIRDFFNPIINLDHPRFLS